MAETSPVSNAPAVLPTDACIYVAGHRGMVGSAIVRRLKAEGYERILTRSHAELDLTDQRAVQELFRSEGIGRLPGGGPGGGDPRQQHLSGGFHLREPDD